MLYYFFSPSVPFLIGERTVGDIDNNASNVTHLHLQFEGPIDDDIIGDCFDKVIAITEGLRDKLLASGLTGFEISTLEPELTYDPQWDRIDATLPDLPKMFWMRISGTGGREDFGLLDGRLIISDKARQLLETVEISEAEFEDYIPEDEPPYITRYFTAEMPPTIERRLQGFAFAYLPANGIELQWDGRVYYCVSASLLSKLTERRATGYTVLEPISDPSEPVPDRPFSILHVNGVRGRHDFVKEPELPLLLSERIIDVFEGCSLPNISIAPLTE